jgi:hypothetical protein
MASDEFCAATSFARRAEATFWPFAAPLSFVRCEAPSTLAERQAACRRRLTAPLAMRDDAAPPG